MKTRGVLLIRESQLEGILDLDKLVCKGNYPCEYFSIKRGKAKKACEESLIKSAKKNNYDLVVLSNEHESKSKRRYSVNPTFYCFK